MATRASLGPLAAEFPGSAFPELAKNAANRYVLLFDAATDETAYWTFVAPQGLTTPLTLTVYGYCVSATSGRVIVGVQVEAITPLDALDARSASSFDTVNTSASTTVPGSAGTVYNVLPLTLSNNDTIAAGDLVRIAISRLATNVNDDAAGDYALLAAELQDAAA